MKYFIRIIFIILFGINFSCLKKNQEHDITAPEIPYYDISGTVTDIDSDEIIAGAIVQIFPKELLFKVSFTSAIDTTDSQGNYTFQAITPGSFIVFAYRDGSLVLQENLTLEFEPKTADLKLPKPLVTATFLSSTEYDTSDGIHWLSSEKLARVVLWSTDHHLIDNPGWHQRVDEGSFTHGFKVIGTKVFENENPPFHSLAFLGFYWTLSENGTKILLIDSSSGQLVSEHPISMQGADLTADERYLWASTKGGHILKFDGHPAKLVQDYQLEDEKLSGIAWGKNAIWTGESNRELLIKRDSDMKPALTYRLFYKNPAGEQTTLTDILYLSFDYSGYLWLANISGYYRFQIP